MTRGPSKAARNRKYAPKDSNIKPSNSLKALKEIRNTEVCKFTSVKNTSSAYDGHCAHGRAFLQGVVVKRKEDESITGPNDDGICTAQPEKAFNDTAPNQYSALALEMFLVQKCYNEGCGKDTADGIYSAFAALWDQMYAFPLICILTSN